MAVELFDLLTTGALLLDDELRLVRLNSAAEALLELSARQAIGERFAVMFPRGVECHAVIDRARSSASALSEREMTLELASGRRVTVDFSVRPLTEQGEPGGLLVELARIDRHLRISREEQVLNQNEVARTVVRGLAHEIRNPLGGIRGAAQLLERELPNEELQEYTTVIINEADRLHRLLDRLLGPNLRPEFRMLNVHEVTERVLRLARTEADGSGVNIQADYDPSIPPFYGDLELLIQALLNVVRNALHAVNGVGEVILRTRIARQRTVASQYHRLAVRIDILDDGPGVPPELWDTLFYPMVTGHPDGTGLGLSIAQSIVHQHGGIIELNRVGCHTVFSVRLPLEAQQ
ncbi:MAG: PAS domain-containing protein [Chromatiales bacterium]|nr:PAS domain-containing protein [Chromatiales bacterium]